MREKRKAGPSGLQNHDAPTRVQPHARQRNPLERVTHYSDPRPAKEGEPVDEVVMFNAYVHLEAMNDSTYALIVTTAK